MVGELNVDFFHLGLLLVVIMIFITGIVLCVAVAGVCCFHWLDSSDNRNSDHSLDGNKSPTPSQIREQIWRLDNELSQQLRRYQERGKRLWRDDVMPPSYDTLFPTPHPPRDSNANIPLPPPPAIPSSSSIPTQNWRDNFTLYV